MSGEDRPWIEKYRPESLDDIVGQDEIIHKLKNYQSISKTPHFLFIGKPGIGKTATARAFAKHLNVPLIVTNASDERKLTDVREKLIPYLQTVSPKIILLDEADMLDNLAQNALRGPLEFAAKNTDNRVILTANNPTKVIEPLQSRCSIQRFKTLTEGKASKVLYNIMKQENMVKKVASNKQELKETLKYLFNYSNGDMRKAVGALEDISMTQGKVSIETIQQYFQYVTLAKEVVNNSLQGNWQQALEGLENLLLEKQVDGKEVLAELYNASPEIESVVLRLKFAESLKQADIALSYAGTNPLIQLSECVMRLYVSKNLVRKEDQKISNKGEKETES